MRTSGLAVRLWATVALVVLPACALFDSAGDDDNPGAPDGGVGAVCTRSRDCSDTLVCAAGHCQLPGSTGLGGACWATRDCQGGLYCQPQIGEEAGICAPAGSADVGAPCATASECMRGLVCVLQGFTGSCAEDGNGDLGGACSSTLDCLAGLACAADGTCKSPFDAYPPFDGAECQPDEPPFRSYFEVPRPGTPPADFFRLPFPNDARVSEAGELDMSDFPRPGLTPLGVDLVGLYVDALVADFQGFSAAAAITFRFSGKIDDGTATGMTVKYVDVTEGDPSFGGDRSLSWATNTGRTKFICPSRITVRNKTSEPLRPGHTYAVYLTTGIHGTDGSTPAQDADLAAVLADSRPQSDEALGHAWDVYAPFRDYLATGEDTPIDPATIANVAVFTVQDTIHAGQVIAEATRAAPAPVLSDLTLCDGSAVSPCDDGTPQRACGAPDSAFYEIHGKFSVPIFQAGTAPYETPADGGNIDLSGGTPQPVRTEDVCFALSIPKGASMPAGGWPVVVFGHGTGGSFRSFISSNVAKNLATASPPMAVFGFEGVLHGARRNGSTRDPDGLVFNVLNPQAARDNNLQGGADVIQALRVAELSAVTVAGVGSVDLDAAHAYYFGHSQGSNVASPVLSTSNATSAVILSGAGAFLTDGLLKKTSPVDAKAGLEFLIGEDVTSSHPMMTIWQTYFDRIDPLNYAPLWLKRTPAGIGSKNVYMSFGVGDTYAPPDTLQDLAQTAGFPPVNPVLDDIGIPGIDRPIAINMRGADLVFRTAACFQYTPDGDYDGHFVATEHPQAIADWVAFLTSYVTTGTATVPVVP